MTPEQQKCWDLLCVNSENLCHTFGKELQSIKGKKKFHARADEYLHFIISNFDDDGALRTLKTWLCVYKLPLEPAKLSCMEPFHEKYGRIVSSQKFKSYELGVTE